MRVFEVCKAMVETGMQSSLSDAGVGALAARAAVIGAGLNVKINAASLNDRAAAQDLIAQAEALIAQANDAEQEILSLVNSKL